MLKKHKKINLSWPGFEPTIGKKSTDLTTWPQQHLEKEV